jgi:hypothetical protein
MAPSTEYLFALYYLLWVIVPLIPALLTYWMFPKNPITATGALSGLTVSMTGAFAAYVIVFLLTSRIIGRMEDALGASIVPMWRVNATVTVEDENGKAADPRLLEALSVEPKPPVYNHSNQLVEIWVPELNNSLPKLVFSIDKFGSTAVNLEDPDVAKDSAKRVITIKKAVTIKRFPDLGVGISQLSVMPR